MRRFFMSLMLLAAATPLTAKSRGVVGTWIVRDSDAPFPIHMYVFNSDGTMQQANPDAGNPNSSDSDGRGIWVKERGRIQGKWVEIIADRVTHKFTETGEISFVLSVDGDRLKGSRSARFFDVDGKAVQGPFEGTFSGTRVTLP